MTNWSAYTHGCRLPWLFFSRAGRRWSCRDCHRAWTVVVDRGWHGGAEKFWTTKK